MSSRTFALTLCFFAMVLLAKSAKMPIINQEASAALYVRYYGEFPNGDKYEAIGTVNLETNAVRQIARGNIFTEQYYGNLGIRGAASRSPDTLFYKSTKGQVMQVNLSSGEAESILFPSFDDEVLFLGHVGTESLDDYLLVASGNYPLDLYAVSIDRTKPDFSVNTTGIWKPADMLLESIGVDVKGNRLFVLTQTELKCIVVDDLSKPLSVKWTLNLDSLCVPPNALYAKVSALSYDAVTNELVFYFLAVDSELGYKAYVGRVNVSTRDKCLATPLTKDTDTFKSVYDQATKKIFTVGALETTPLLTEIDTVTGKVVEHTLDVHSPLHGVWVV